jgi:membrane associated rhomboid family serine protease
MAEPNPSDIKIDEDLLERKDEALFDEVLIKTHPRLVVVPALITINCLVFAACGIGAANGLAPNWEAVLDLGSNIGPLTAGGEPWRLASSMFLHANIVHLLVNMLALFDAGRHYERIVGAWRCLLVYVLSGLAGGAMSVAWNPWVNGVGASGAIFGILGAMLVVMLSGRYGVPWPVLKGRAISVAVLVGYSIIETARGGMIDHAAHFGGFIAGALLGLVLAPSAKWETRGGGSETLRVAIAVAICAFAVPALVSNASGLREAWITECRFLDDLKWFGKVEQQMREDVNRLGRLYEYPASKPRAENIAKEAAEAHQRLALDQLHERSNRRRLQELTVELADLRRQAYGLLAQEAGPGGVARLEKTGYSAMINQSNEVAAKIRQLQRR